MCLLNGDVGGSLPSSVDFGKIDTYSDVYTEVTLDSKYDFEVGDYYIFDGKEKDYVLLTEEWDGEKQLFTKLKVLNQESITIQDIIREAVHTYGREPYSNIIINGLEEDGLELLEYRGDIPLYLAYNVDAKVYDQMTLDGTKTAYISANSDDQIYLDNELNEKNNKTKLTYKTGVEDMDSAATIVWLKVGTEETRTAYQIRKIEYGNTVGYQLTDLTYAGDLISSIGETLTTMLDKIKTMLGSYEYFYDVDGHFIFQEKPTYSRISWNSIVNTDNNSFARDNAEVSKYSFRFDDAKLIQKFTNTPAINNIKNDYSVWGTRKGVTGADLLIHARYAIMEKPTYYHTLSRDENQDPEGVYSIDKYDWREIIYQMAIDYFKHNQDIDFLQQVKKVGDNITYYPTGITGYEIFYTDLQGFWRQLYNPFYAPVPETEGGKWEDIKEYILETDEEGNETVATLEEIEKLIAQNQEDLANALAEINAEDYETSEAYEEALAAIKSPYLEKDRKLRDLDSLYYRWKKVWQEYTNEVYEDNERVYVENDYYPENSEYEYWHKNVVEAPDQLNFWFDFYDQGDSLMQYSISSIGDRPKVLNDSKITSVYVRETPQLLFCNNDDELEQIDFKTGYTPIYRNDSMMNMFSISSQGKSAKEEFEELFNQYSYCTEQASITAIPIYYLEPNTVIHIYNEASKINGDYEVSKLSLSLSNGGMMTITATKIVNPM